MQKGTTVYLKTGETIEEIKEREREQDRVLSKFDARFER